MVSLTDPFDRGLASLTDCEPRIEARYYAQCRPQASVYGYIDERMDRTGISTNKQKRIGLANGTGIAESCHGNNVRLPGRRCEAVCTQDVQKYGAWLLT